jgi:hypothetical protein
VRRGVALGLGLGLAAASLRAIRRRSGERADSTDSSASAGSGSARGGAAPTRAELYREAQRLGIPGRSRMTKRQLEQALEAHRGAVAA